MMFLGKQRTLGISLTSEALQLSEIHRSGRQYKLVRTASFALTEQKLVKEPAGSGKELAKFLKSNGFSAKVAAAGLSAQCLMFKEFKLPKAAPEAMAGMLAIHAERDFSLEPSSLALDYLAGPAEKDGQNVVLAAAMKEKIEPLKQLAQAAGLQLRVITASALAVSGAAGSSDILYFGANGAESVETCGPGIRRVRYIASGSVLKKACDPKSAPQVIGELRRALALSGKRADAEQPAIWDDIGIDETIIESFQPNKTAKQKKFYDAVVLNGTSPENCAASTALALCAAEPARAGIDFLHSRMAPKPPSKITSTRIWTVVAAAVVLSGLAYLLLDWQSNVSEVAELKQRRDSMKESVKSAKDFITRIKNTSTWYDKRPNYLECLRSITQTFPEDGKIWASNLTVREDMQGVLTAHAQDEKGVLEVLDRLKSNHAFADVKMLQIRAAGGQSTEVAFSVSFSYRGAE
jgi:hypothetical protein